MHTKRAEHWVVVSGLASVTIDENVITLFENQSTYIPIGSKHRLANVGKIVTYHRDPIRNISGGRRYNKV